MFKDAGPQQVELRELSTVFKPECQAGDCQPLAAATAQAIANNPGGYSVELRTAADGVVGGMLSK